MRGEVLVARNRAEQIKENFKKFHRDNPRVYQLFKRFTFEALQSGHRHFSADMIVHRIRWETSVVTKSNDGLKINDHYVSYYARMVMKDHPQLEKRRFFRTRRRTSRDRPPTKNDWKMEEELGVEDD